jgi:peptide/nickel transport system ATP-binding protein
MTKEPYGADDKPADDRPIVEIRELFVTFNGRGKPVRVINGVSLQVGRGQTLALIGESGSGKSVTLRTIMRLYQESHVKMSGQLDVDGIPVFKMNKKELTAFRGAVVSMIFQEPLLALDPVYTLGEQIVEAIRTHREISREDARRMALELFQRVRIPSPENRLDAYPHELSGGMRQRAMIALALACHPKVLLADEPTTALDATVQIQILLLLRELQKELGIAIIFVTHDIGAATEVASHFAVMYAGYIVEQGSVDDVISRPSHPYTRALLESRAHGALKKGERLTSIPGAPPDLADPQPGCAFAPRCRYAQAVCQEKVPDIARVDAEHPEHFVRCFHARTP